MDAEQLGKKLCVTGAGALGLVTTKNFIEQGFDVIAYERND
jgi:Trk K+ transport system NAD-binding subunit